MPQEPLSPAGVLQKQTDLYALSDNALLMQANLIRTDFINWMFSNFIFNATQQSYLNGMDPKWIQFASCQTGFAVENRRPIILDAPFPSPPPIISKMVSMDTTLKATYSQLNGFMPTGDLRFSIVY